jgi:uncharacterized protein YhdP
VRRPKGPEGDDAFPISGVALRAGELQMLGQRLNDVRLRAVMEEGGWQARLASREATGDVVWRDQGRGRLQARFKQLAIGSPDKDGEAEREVPDEERLSELPGLDISADSFVLRGRQLGRLDLKAANQGETWRLEQLSIANPDGVLSGKGLWRPGAREETRLDFRLEVASVEKLLARFGYPRRCGAAAAAWPARSPGRGRPPRCTCPAWAATCRWRWKTASSPSSSRGSGGCSGCSACRRCRGGSPSTSATCFPRDSPSTRFPVASR